MSILAVLLKFRKCCLALAAEIAGFCTPFSRLEILLNGVAQLVNQLMIQRG